MARMNNEFIYILLHTAVPTINHHSSVMWFSFYFFVSPSFAIDILALSIQTILFDKQLYYLFASSLLSSLRASEKQIAIGCCDFAVSNVSTTQDHTLSVDTQAYGSTNLKRLVAHMLPPPPWSLLMRIFVHHTINCFQIGYTNKYKAN